jgi:hypothetical protein
MLELQAGKNDKVQKMINLYEKLPDAEKPPLPAEVKLPLVDPSPIWRDWLETHPVFCRRVIDFWHNERDTKKQSGKKKYPFAGPRLTNPEGKGSIRETG